MIFFYISLLTYVCYCAIKYRESIHHLEKVKYDSKKYLKYIKENSKSIFINPELIITILIIIAFYFNIKVIGISTLIVYTLLFLYKLKTDNKKLKMTKQTKTRIISIIIIYLILNIWFCFDYNSYHSASIIFDNTPLYYIILYIITYLSYIVTYAINIIVKPIDK
ncbi:MAG: hypothetical protein IKG27_00215 [Bacilli bacterium]|nr:hypothetical protein [Bacilli bacterium]